MPKLMQATLLTLALSASGIALAQTTPPSGQPGQTPSTMPDKAAPPDKMTPPSAAPGASTSAPQWYTAQAGEMRVSKLIGTTVKNAAGESIGDINEVVLGRDGKVAAVVIGVGGFLGIGEREVAVRFDSLRLAQGTDQRTTATLDATKDTLKAAPEWKWSSDRGNGGTTGTGTKPVR
jgi:sporulation protein YlmC with PRC-barrel domain